VVKFDGPVEIVEVKQLWSVVGWVTKNILSRAFPCLGKHIKPLVPAAFVVVSTDQPTLGPRSYVWPDDGWISEKNFDC
jgi:hypothetical protein